MSRIKVLPVYPEIPDSFWSLKKTIELIGRKASMPPIGLATVMAMLDEKYFELKPIVDLNVQRISESDIKESDLVFTSAMSVQRGSLEKIINIAHKFGKKVVAGGPLPSAFEEEIPADYLVLNEAELTLPPFVEDLLTGNPKRLYNYDTVLSRMKGKVEIDREGRPLLKQTPIPRWDLLNLKNYASLAMQYTRGCPFNCNFCDIVAQFGRIPRTKTVKQILSESQAIYDLGWRGPVFVVDDNFIGDKPGLNKLLPEWARWQKEKMYPLQLFTEASIDLGFDQQNGIRKLMVEAGFDSVFVGIESLDPEVLIDMGKRQNLRNLEQSVENIQRSGLEVMGGFIVGSDKDKPNVFDLTFDFIQRAGIVTPMVGLLNAIRGTILYDRMKSDGRLRMESSGNNTHDLNLNFDPIMDERMLIGGYVHLLERLFNSRNYYDRCRVLRDRKGPARSGIGISLNYLVGMVKITYENLVKNPDHEFRKYIAETLIRFPNKFPSAIAEAMRLHHFRSLTKEMAQEYRKSF